MAADLSLAKFGDLAGGAIASVPSVPALLVAVQGRIIIDLVGPDNVSLLHGAAHVGSRITEECGRWTTCQHVFSFTDRRYLDTVLIPTFLRPEPQVFFRVGVSSPNGPKWRATVSHWLTYYKVDDVSTEAGAYQLVIETADALWALDKNHKTISRQGTVESIVTQIAKESNIKASVAPTDKPLRLIQSFQSDFEFIITRLTPRALTQQRQGDFRLQVRGDRLVYGPVDFEGRRAAVHIVDASGGAVSSVKEEDASHLALARGASGVRAIVANPYTADNQSRVSTGDNQPKTGLNEPKQVLSNEGPTSGAPSTEDYRTIALTLGEDVAEASERAQNEYEKARSDMYRLTFNMSNILGVQVGDFVQLRSPDAGFAQAPTRSANVITGYVVKRIDSVIQSGALTSQVLAVRGQLTRASNGQQVATGSANALTPANAATGAPVRQARQGGIPLDANTQ